MTIKYKLAFETISAITLASLIGFFWAMYSDNQQPKFNVFASIPIVQEDTVTPTPSAPKPLIVSESSPDGTKKVTMRTTFNTDTTRTYTFSVTDGSGKNGQTIYSKTLNEAKSMSIPFNTWSPDNKYFFIQEQVLAGNATIVMAFEATGEPFTNEEQYLDVTNLFFNKNTGTVFKEATGWASETLLIINTTAPNNEKGPSYWFEIPSKAILQLSTEF